MNYVQFLKVNFCGNQPNVIFSEPFDFNLIGVSVGNIQMLFIIVILSGVYRLTLLIVVNN